MQNIKALVEAHNTVDLKAALAAASELEIRRALHELPPAERGLVFRLLSKDQALEAFEELDADQQEELLKSLTDEQVKLYLETLAPDARVRLLDEVPANVAKRWLASVSPQERELTDRLLGYGSETAGRMMTPEFISLSKAMTADEALAKVRQEAHDTETVYTLYVTDTTKRLEGVLTLRELLVAEPTAKVADVMHTGIVSVGTAEDQEQVARLLQDLDLLALPVVDSEQRIVGIVTVDDAIDVIEEEATDDIYDQAGLVDLTRREESRSEVLLGGSIWSIWKVRLPFLLITVVAGVLAALVMDGFEEAIAYIVPVAFFIPLVMDMGGNVGTQSTTIFTRGVSLGQIQLRTFARTILKEITVGFSIGIVVGAISGTVAWLMFGSEIASDYGAQGHHLGLAVGLAVLATSTLAALLGFLVPWVLMKFGADQVAGSAPIITSIKDIAGLFIYFGFVYLFMGHLIG